MDLGQVFTRRIIADYMVSLFSLKKDALVLDPCFGSGVFLNSCISKGYTNLVGVEIDEHLYSEYVHRNANVKLYNKDFLSLPISNSFDGIIMNPPYVRQEKIDDLESLGVTKSILRKNPIFKSLPLKANLYMYFVLKAIDMLVYGGELIIIFPCSWMTTKTGKKFSELINDICSIEYEITVQGNAFESAALVDVVILKLCKKDNMIARTQYRELNIKGDNIYETWICEREKLNLFNIQFSKYATIQRGITTGFNKMFINPVVDSYTNESFLEPILSSPKAIKGFNVDSAKFDTLLVVPENYRGQSCELNNYLEHWFEYINIKQKPCGIYNKIRDGKAWYSVKTIDSKGILLGYFIRYNIRFVLNDSGVLARDNFYIIRPNINIYLMLALLNNYYTYYQLEKMGKFYGAGLLKIQSYDIQSLLFPDLEIMAQDDLLKLTEYGYDLANDIDVFEVMKAITMILRKYSNYNVIDVREEYYRLRNNRLNSRGEE